ncbi:uncharacterized protein BDR25DRAFT_205673, partial [Lindgomyces ingoldianus]
KGVWEQNREKYRYSQAAHIGDCIKRGGQKNYSPHLLIFDLQKNQGIDQAFANVDLCGRGWLQALTLNSYHLPLNDEALGTMARNFEKWVQRHWPIWATVGATKLGLDGMRVEIEVVTHDSRTAK